MLLDSLVLGGVQAGVVTPAYGTTADLYPTFVKLAALQMPKDRVFAGGDRGIDVRSELGRDPCFSTTAAVMAAGRSRKKYFSPFEQAT